MLLIFFVLLSKFCNSNVSNVSCFLISLSELCINSSRKGLQTNLVSFFVLNFSDFKIFKLLIGNMPGLRKKVK